MNRLAFAFCCLVSLVAFPQPVAPVAEASLGADLQPLLDLASSKGLGPAAVVVAVLLVLSRLAMHYGSKLPGKLGLALASPVASWALPVVLGVLGALGTALATGAPLSLGLVLGAVLAGMAAGGTGNKAAVLAKAVEKGEVAAAAVDSKTAAIIALKADAAKP
jgi:hypothetical protein